MKLYIIGNGFDLHHGLNTSYYDFSIFLKNKNSEIYDLLSSYISFPSSDKDLWSKFEENLANLDHEYLLSDNSDYIPDVSSDDFRDRDRYAFEDVMLRIKDLLTDGLLTSFREFILDVDVVIPNAAFDRKIQIDINSLFLNFNYTNTLEVIYNVKTSNINYIHNSAISDCEYIILGHGRNPKDFEEELPEPPDDLPETQYEEWYEHNSPYDPFFDPGKDALMKYFAEMYKPTSEIIRNNSSFFFDLKKVDQIFVFGHSLSDVDLPYFEEIFKNVGNVKWVVSYFSASDIERIEKTLCGIGVEKQNIELIRLNDILLDNSQLKLDLG